MGPFFLSRSLPRLGLHLPDWAAQVNAWLIASSPLGVGLKLAMGIGASLGLIDAVAWMAALQLLGGTILLAGCVWRLRSSIPGQRERRDPRRSLARKGPVWRLRPRPAVGDDPILWREMYTARDGGFAKALGSLINLAVLAALVFGTYHYARPALAEVWRHGYGSGVATADRPEMNLFVGVFRGGLGDDRRPDAARAEFNLFLRWITVPVAMIVVFVIAGTASEVFTRERAKETWTSLLATPMTARQILRSAILAAAWRLREMVTIVLILWTLGLIAGSIHPLGYLVSVTVLAASMWLLAAWGALAAVRHQDQARATMQGLNLTMSLLVVSSALPVPAAGPAQLGDLRRRLVPTGPLLVARLLPGGSRGLPVCGLSSAAMDRDQHRRRAACGRSHMHARNRRPGPGRLVVLAIHHRALRSPGRSTVAARGDIRAGLAVDFPDDSRGGVPTGGTRRRRLGYAETAGSARTIRGGAMIPSHLDPPVERSWSVAAASPAPTGSPPRLRVFIQA